MAGRLQGQQNWQPYRFWGGGHGDLLPPRGGKGGAGGEVAGIPPGQTRAHRKTHRWRGHQGLAGAGFAGSAPDYGQDRYGRVRNPSAGGPNDQARLPAPGGTLEGSERSRCAHRLHSIHLHGGAHSGEIGIPAGQMPRRCRRCLKPAATTIDYTALAFPMAHHYQAVLTRGVPKLYLDAISWF